MIERLPDFSQGSNHIQAEPVLYDHLDVVRAVSMGDGGCPSYGNADVVEGAPVIAPVDLVSRQAIQSETSQSGH